MKNLRNLKLIVILLAIISLSTALYFLVAHFSSSPTVVSQVPTNAISPTLISTQTSFCQQNQLSAILSAQGAAGNIFATLTLTNVGKTTCEITLGNTITATFDANNIMLHNQQTVPSGDIILTPGEKAYSQIHYPNGPQCQSGIIQKPLTVQYKSNQTTIAFVPDVPAGKVIVQACNSEAEKTTIDIWPLSKNPITP